MTPEKQASLLAEWLQKPPGTPPPEGLDPESVEAVYAMRPELAPAPKVSLDDILAGVTEGPFARTAEVPISETDAEVVVQAADSEGRGEVLDLGAARRRRQRIWGGVGVVAAAALVLFTVFPEGDEFNELATEDLPTEVAEAPVAEDPKSAFEAAPAQPAPPAEAVALDQPAKTRAESRERSVIDSLTSGRYDVVDLEEPEAAAELKASEGGASYGEALDEWDADALEEAEEQVQSLGYLSDDDFAQNAAADYGDYAAEEDAGSGGGLFDRKKESRPTRSSSSSTATSGMDYDAPAGEPEPIPSDLDALRAAAVPGDYSASWYLKALDDAELDRFDKAVATGDYAALIGDSNALIGQDMAFRAAQQALSGGDAGTAIAYARKGQGRSSANTAFRANLYYIEGLALERRGDTEGAKRAYTTAANLNRAR